MTLDEEAQSILAQCIVLKKELLFISKLNNKDYLTQKNYLSLSKKIELCINNTTKPQPEATIQKLTEVLKNLEKANLAAYERLAKIKTINDRADQKNVYLTFYIMYRRISNLGTIAAKNMLYDLQPTFIVAKRFFELYEQQIKLQTERQKYLSLHLNISDQNVNNDPRTQYLRRNIIQLTATQCRNESNSSRIASLLLIPCVKMYRALLHESQNLDHANNQTITSIGPGRSIKSLL